MKATHEHAVLDLLADELVLAQRVASVAADGVHWALVNLVLDGREQHEQWLAGALL